MSSSSSCLNSAFAAASFSPSSFRNLEAMGGPWVTMWWTTSWLTALKRTLPPGTHPAGGCRPPSSVPDSAYQLVWPHSRRQRTTRRAVLRPPPPTLPSHPLKRLVWRWLLRRWLLRRWLLRRWLLRRWLLRRCGLKEKRTPPPVCTAAQNRSPPSPWAGCAAAGRRADYLCYQARHIHSKNSLI
jgi:hypothetical protein